MKDYKYYNNGVTPKGVGLSGSDILLRNTRLQSLTRYAERATICFSIGEA
nr:MAG TPA: hypothetical protein [Microviridae sp.]